MTNPHYKCFFLGLFISNIKLAISLLPLFISIFNLSLSDTVSQRSKLLSNKLYPGILVKYFMRRSVVGTMKQYMRLVFYLV